jgi:phosphocarrier protein
MKIIHGTILAPTGLTARLSSQIVAEANKYKSNLIIRVLDEEADLKSIMNVMALVVPHGNDYTIEIEGEDEELAESSFNKLLKEINLKN